MSEALSRRTVLAAGLAGAVETLFGSLHAVLAQDRAPAQTCQELTIALRDYVIAHYDVRLKRSTAIADDVRNRLAAALTAAGLERELVGQLEAHTGTPGLETYLEKNGFRFHRVLSSFADFGYALQRLDPTIERTYTLFDRSTLTKVQIVREELIPNITSYASMLEKNDGPDRTVLEVGGYCRADQPIITLFPEKYRVNAALFTDQVLKGEKDITEQLAKPDFLDEFIKKPSPFANRANAVLTQDFWKHLGRQMLTLRFRDTQKQFPKREELIARLAEDYQRDLELHEAMHAQDATDWKFLDDYSAEIQKDMKYVRDYHMELRGALSTLAHGRSAWGLAWQTRLLGMPNQGGFVSHFKAAEYITKKFTEYILTHPKDFPAFTFTREHCDIFKQFTKITDEQAKTVARDIFTNTYNGKTLKEYIQDFAPAKR